MVGTRTGTNGPIARGGEVTVKRNWLHSSTALTGWASALPIAVIGAGLIGATPAHANPEGANIVAGGITLDESTPKTLNIYQSTDKAIINWNSFSIKLDETTNFLQPSSSSITLNRVTGSTSSAILGTLTANGQIMLLNPNGILFGANSRIDVAGLVATTHDITDANFLNGQYDFSGATDSNATVVNEGAITIADGGLAAFVAPGVENSGTIYARLGRVTLAAGDAFTLDLYGDQLVSLAVDGTIARQIVDENGDPLGALVTNSGQITADGGSVVLSVAAAQGVVDNVINMSGIIQAHSVGEQNGKIVLMGGDAGIVAVSGTLDASGDDAGETGGTVHALGEKVGLFAGANIDVSGDAGGGTALIGGDYQGGGSVPLARRTYVSAVATIDASAGTSGDGGTVVVWAEEITRYYGQIIATGGSESGDGGFVEVSGKDTLGFHGDVNLAAPNGEIGTLLLDPTVLTIIDAAAAGGTLDASLENIAFGDGANDGTDTVSSGALEALGDVAIVLSATDSIIINDLNTNVTTADTLTLATDTSVTFLTGAGGFTMDATNTILVTGDGSLTIDAVGSGGTGDGTISVGTLTTAAGSITLDGTAVTVNGALTTGAVTTDGAASGSIMITSSTGAITLNANLLTGDATVADGGGGTLADSGGITISAGTGVTGSGTITTGDAELTGDASGTDVATSGAISITAGTGGTTGGIGLSATDAIATGSATTGAADDDGVVGNIALISLDEINNGTASTAVDISIGTVVTAASATDGELTVTTSGASGNAFITSGEALIVDVLDTADGSSQTLSIVTTGDVDLTWKGASSLDTDAVTLGGATTGVLTFSAAQTVGSLTGTGNSVVVSANIDTTASTTSGTASGDISLTADTNALALGANLTTGDATVADTAGDETATTGNITLSGAIDVTGAGVATTGAADITGADAAGTDVATSGSISVTTTGGTIGLSGTDALTVGDADRSTADTTDTANVGDITLSSSTEINNGTATTALDVSFGTATAGTTDAGVLSATTTAAAGNIFVDSGEALEVGTLDTLDASTQTILTTSDVDLTWSGASSLDIDGVTFTAAAGVLTISAAQTVGSFTGTGDSVVVSGTGSITTTASTTSGTASGNISLTAGDTSITLDGSLATGSATVVDTAGDETATSGDITLFAETDISGAGTATTGAAEISGIDAAGTDVVTSGSLSVTAGNGGATGGIGLSAADALATGNATRSTATTTDTANVGDITLVSEDEINNNTASTAMDIKFGTATAGTTDAGVLSVTTTTGGAFITSGEAFETGAISSAADFSLSSAGSLLIGTITATGNTVTLTSTGGAINAVTDDATADVDAATINLTAAAGGIGTTTILDVTASTALNADTDAGDGANIVIDSIGDLPVGTISAGAGNVTLDSTAAINDAADDLITDITGGQVTLTAADEVGGMPTAGTTIDTRGALEVASVNLNIDVAAGNIVVTGVGATRLTADTDSGSIDVLSDGPFVKVILVEASATVKIEATVGEIFDDLANSDIDITAAAVDLDAAIGIGATADRELEFAVSTTIDADSTSGNIEIDNAATGEVTINSMTTGTGTISYDQTGDRSLTVTSATTTSGTITITNTGADDAADFLRVDTATAGGGGFVTLITNSAGDIQVGDLNAAVLVSVTSAGAIADNGDDDAGADITASFIDLNARDGIGGFDVAGTTLTIDSLTSGDIDVDSILSTAVTVTTLTTKDGGNITFEQSGGGAVSFVTVTAVQDGTPTDGEADITLSNSGGNLTITTGVAAGASAGDANYTTTTSGNIELTGTTTAGGEVNVLSAGDIDGAGLVTSPTIDLTAAANGIGTGTTIRVAASTVLNADTTADDASIVIDSIGNLPAGLIDAGGGDVTLSSTTTINSASDDGIADVKGATVFLTATAGGIGTTAPVDVTATTALNADTVADGANINIDSIGDLPVQLVDAGAGTVTLNSTGAIDGFTPDNIADVIGGTVNLIAAAGGIGTTAIIDVAATTQLNADTVAGDEANILIDSIGNMPIGLVDAGGGDVTLSSTTTINSTANDLTADVVGDTIILNATLRAASAPPRRST